eukprot:360078-Chlamydomonas_euryale.AAC.2
MAYSSTGKGSARFAALGGLRGVGRASHSRRPHVPFAATTADGGFDMSDISDYRPSSRHSGALPLLLATLRQFRKVAARGEERWQGRG